MTEQTVSFQELEAAFIEVLKNYIGIENENQRRLQPISGMVDELTNIQIAGIENKVALKCFGTQEQQTMPTYHDTGMSLDMDGKTQIRKLIWSLIFQGKLVPGTDTNNSLPWLTITPEGEHWLSEGDNQNSSIFYSTEQYLQRLTSNNVELGDIAQSYLVEAITSYFNSCPRASMVMVGVAMEALFDELDDAWSATSIAGWAAPNLEPKTRSYVRRLDRFQRLIESRYNEITTITGVENPQLFITPILDHIRQVRNDGAHSALPNHDQNEAFAMLELFTRVATIMVKLRDYLSNEEGTE